MTSGTILPWLSSGKPLTAVAIAQLWEKSLLDLDDPVAHHIPEFAQQGKETIAIRHLLTHTAGLRGVLGKWEDQPWEQIIATICATRPEPNWKPGTKAGYHAASSWYILAEIIQRLDPKRRLFADYVREEIFQPIGMTRSGFTITPVDDQVETLPDTRALALGQAQGVSPGSAVRPGSSARGPIRELGLFYEALLQRGRPPGLTPQTVEALTARHRVGMYDQTFKHVIDWGLGFICNSNPYGADTVPYNFGPHASPRAFGHSGARSSTGYCDPEHELVVAWVMNGMPDEAAHQQRVREINSAIYEDLGLVP
jgi:CubicO group peptidase (beta-lactamase class C family)